MGNPRGPPGVQGEKPSFNQILNNAIKESGNQEVVKLKEEIDAVKRQKSDIITKMKKSRRRLSYKEAEDIAIKRLLEIEKGKEGAEAKRKKIGYLKRMKNKLEFRISTEAKSLAEEKDLVRKINDINKQLDDAYKTIRLERKAEYIKGDIEECKKSITEYETKATELNKKLDELYDKIRKLLGIEREKRMHVKKRVQQPPPQLQEINLEDIAVIKKKEKKPSSDSEDI